MNLFAEYLSYAAGWIGDQILKPFQKSKHYDPVILEIGPDHWLKGVKRQPLIDGGPMPVRRFLVEHFTGGWTDAAAVMKERGVSAHFIVKRDGSIIQCVPCNRVAYHAGRSKWKDPKTGITYDGLNDCAIGIEIENCGDLERDIYPKTMGELAGKPIPRLEAAHPHGGPAKRWEVYPEAQVAAVTLLSKVLVKRYNLDDVLGHQDASPGRKTDPGPAFPMNSIRRACGFPDPLPGYST